MNTSADAINTGSMGFQKEALLVQTLAPAAITVVPLPAAAWLFGVGLVGLLGVARRKRQSFRILHCVLTKWQVTGAYRGTAPGPAVLSGP